MNMYVCMYVCMHACMHVCMHVHFITFVFVHVYMGFIFECTYLGIVFTNEHVFCFDHIVSYVHIEKEEKS